MSVPSTIAATPEVDPSYHRSISDLKYPTTGLADHNDEFIRGTTGESAFIEVGRRGSPPSSRHALATTRPRVHSSVRSRHCAPISRVRGRPCQAESPAGLSAGCGH
jgi:hypothetical protein